MNKRYKIIVGMSGGVDSSVAAYLLKQQGHDVSGLFMKNWEGDDNDEYCSAETDLADAKAVCARLQIPLHSVNFASEYWDRVFAHFLEEYRAGRTPNPDILCNKEIKFKAFLDHALAQGADFIATGHYVRRVDVDGEVRLVKGLDANKDQSYFLHALNQHQLRHSLFPIGDLQKADVRAIAEEQGFINHNKKDSTGICFIGERKFTAFLKEYLLAQPGDIRTTDGNIIGKHDGLMYYTLGQRQGLHIGGLKNAKDAPWYVLQKDIDNNVLIVGQGQEHPLLYSQSLVCKNTHWIAGHAPTATLSCSAKTRYRQADQACTVHALADGNYEVCFSEPQRAVTPGQSIVFYDGDVCLGGGVIDSTLLADKFNNTNERG